MTKIEAAAEAIEAAGWTQLAKEFKTHPQHRAKIAQIVSQDATQRLGYAFGQRLLAALEAAS